VPERTGPNPDGIDATLQHGTMNHDQKLALLVKRTGLKAA